MITIIHGDDIKESRNYLSSLRDKSPSTTTLDGSSLDITILTQELAGDGLFDENKAIFIENLLTKKKKSKELDELVAVIKNYSEKEIFLWEGKELEKRTLSSLPSARIMPFKLPQVLFAFLDSIEPNKGSQLVKLFHQCMTTVEPEMLFAMITRQVRLLLAIANESDNPIEEIKRLAPWQKPKLKKQASSFTKEQISKFYSDLFELDLMQKTGKIAGSLTSSIDILLLKL